jgi:hypothetical protein
MKRFLILALMTACAAAPPTRPADLQQPSVTIRPIGSLSCGPGGTAPLNLAVRVSNHARESIMIRTIRLTTPESQLIAFEPKDNVVNGFLEGSQTDVFPVTVTASVAPDCPRPFRAKAIRAEIEFEARGKRFWETFDLTDIPL